jgi:hypothetical protein
VTDTPQHIKDLQLKLWLEKPPGERLYQTIIDIEDMRNVYRDIKKRLGYPLKDLDPVGEYLREQEEKGNTKDLAIFSSQSVKSSKS